METDISKIVVDAGEFATALRAAIAVAPTKANDPRAVIQLRTHQGMLHVCAAGDGQVFSMVVSTMMADIISGRDEAVEITRAEARVLSAMKMAKEDPEDKPRVGLLIGERSVRRTDESGLGLGIRQVRVRRAHPETLGNIPVSLEGLAAELDEAPPESSEIVPELTPQQWSLIGKVAMALDEPMVMMALPPTPERRTRVLMLSGCARMSVICARAQIAEGTPDSEDALLGGVECSFDDEGAEQSGETPSPHHTPDVARVTVSPLRAV
ncbi:hypothetical protein H7347_06920 [Corynebacterium sp. zg-331]|uniref:hypothetical protein n=1 Tax=unclassified Corynebacterium TaxID=2624378 RepID=UPI00128DD9D3|nr:MULTISPECIES: hypothetical protein [unclassified Corynebacterium]MBC3186304.1 hypothetical protein [Corynebacterium sp. zg-331]MPV52793.1 hypothetical protein [Corynebacterium sp. zg331]